jgi:hypothetical protein
MDCCLSSVDRSLQTLVTTTPYSAERQLTTEYPYSDTYSHPKQSASSTGSKNQLGLKSLPGFVRVGGGSNRGHQQVRKGGAQPGGVQRAQVEEEELHSAKGYGFGTKTGGLKRPVYTADRQGVALAAMRVQTQVVWLS